MPTARSEFDEGERTPREVLHRSLDDAQDQLRRAGARLVRAQRRVRNLELAVQSWEVLVAQYDRSVQSEASDRVHIQL